MFKFSSFLYSITLFFTDVDIGWMLFFMGDLEVCLLKFLNLLSSKFTWGVVGVRSAFMSLLSFGTREVTFLDLG